MLRHRRAGRWAVSGRMQRRYRKDPDGRSLALIRSTILMSLRWSSWSAVIKTRYGRKRGLFRHCSQLVRYRLGEFSSFETIDWGKVTRLVFVCKGNICRSPYAEARARTMNLKSSSFGLEATSGVPANPAAIKAAGKHGLDISSHRARNSSFVPLVSGDLIAVMEPWQARALRPDELPAGVQVTLLGLWCRPPRPHIEDPYGLSDQYFETCFTLIDSALARISSLLQKRDAASQSV